MAEGCGMERKTGRQETKTTKPSSVVPQYRFAREETQKENAEISKNSRLIVARRQRMAVPPLARDGAEAPLVGVGRTPAIQREGRMSYLFALLVGKNLLD